MRILLSVLVASFAACAGKAPAPRAQDSAACVGEVPARRMAVHQALSAEDFRMIQEIVGETPEAPIIRIAEITGKDVSPAPSAGADMVVTVVRYGGHDRCLEVGTNLGSILERVEGRWRLLGARQREGARALISGGGRRPTTRPTP